MSNPEKTLTISRFGEYAFDHRHGLLTRRGKPVHLRPLSTTLLAELLKSPNQVVDRDQLREVLWGRRVVEWEMGLHRLVRELRVALDDDAKAPVYIHTVPRRGYLFRVSDRTMPSTRPASARQRFGWYLAGTLTIPGVVLAICVYAAWVQ